MSSKIYEETYDPVEEEGPSLPTLTHTRPHACFRAHSLTSTWTTATRGRTTPASLAAGAPASELWGTCHLWYKHPRPPLLQRVGCRCTGPTPPCTEQTRPTLGSRVRRCHRLNKVATQPGPLRENISWASDAGCHNRVF